MIRLVRWWKKRRWLGGAGYSHSGPERLNIMDRVYWICEGPNRINTIHKAFCKRVSIEVMIGTGAWVGFDKREAAAVHALNHSNRSAWNCMSCGGIARK